MIPLYLITGFLGSGKTSLLLHLAQQAKEKERRYIFLVNEFSSKDVDGRRLKGLGTETMVIPGGSIFCTCLVQDFIMQLSEIPLKWGNEKIDGVVIEASGMADPSAVDKMLKETQLDSIYEVARVISMADPNTLPKVSSTLKAARQQLSASDLVLLSKGDTVDDRTMAHTRAVIREHNTRASILECHRGVVKGDVLHPVKRKSLSGELMECVDPAFRSCTMDVGAHVSLFELEDFFLEYGPFIHRAKGCIFIDRQWIEFDAVGSLCEHGPGSEQSESRLVLIISKDAPNPDSWIHLLEKVKG